MSATNTTTNYALPQFISTDKPTWLGDFNGAMFDIDDYLKTNANAIAAVKTTADAAATASSVTLLGNQVNNLESAVTALQGNLVKLRVYSGQYTTGTLAGNANHTLNVPMPNDAATILAVIPIGFDPASSWATPVYFDATSTTGTIRIRCQGSTNQYYTIRYIVLYTVA